MILASVLSRSRLLHHGWGAVQMPGSERELNFTEPNLRFEHVKRSGMDVLLVAFAQESSPPWATDDQRYGEGFVMSFPFQLNNFKAAAEALQRMLLQWPVRTRNTETGSLIA
jgi:hypothetical protein